MPYRVLVVEDHKIMRDGIRALLDRGGEFIVEGEAESGTEAIQVCTEIHPDVVLMDIGLPGLNGVDATTELLRNCPNAKVIILSMYDDEESVVSAIRAGARGYVVKRASAGDLLEALRTVARGSSYLSPNVSERLLSRIRRGEQNETAGRHPLLSQLTPREFQVLGMIVEGKASKEIAVLLSLGVETVRSYRKTMMKKLNVNNVAGLIRVALAAGLASKIQQGASGSQ
ncbi:MAG TPA: response regulator transcription factor [Bryobacteraceae bacterium]|jgi:DNA-binding NarL/FixJ family response regulator|nr:response regulator transcription factor [Bryobacteraceae bacterium]